MVSRQPSLLGQTIQVPAGLRGKCRTCKIYGLRARMLTDGTETGYVVEEKFFNGKFTQGTGNAAVWLKCPVDGNLVQFPLGQPL